MRTKKKIQIPYHFTPRDYQLPATYAFERYKRLVLRWHRRCGKDLWCWNMSINKAFQRVGVYWYVFPTAALGRRVIWDGVAKDGFRFMNHIPAPTIASKNSSSMSVTLKNGSSIWIVGSDNMLNVGPNPIGIVYSEFSLQNPSCWNYCRPILAENGGWAVFNFTPRGQNHAFDLEMKNLHNPRWYCQALTVDDTHAISLDAIDDERQSGMDEDTIQQEFWVSYDAAIKGAYYGQFMKQAEEEGRIREIPWERNLPVDLWWDLGMDDQTVIWFVQQVSPSEIRVLDYLEGSGYGLDHYARKIKEKPYILGECLWPHDVEVRELTAGGKTRKEFLEDLGLRGITVPRHNPPDGINAARTILPRCWFHSKNCAAGINALKSYQREWDDKKKCYRPTPRHDWSSHAADAFRTGAMGRRDRFRKSGKIVIPKPILGAEQFGWMT